MSNSSDNTTASMAASGAMFKPVNIGENPQGMVWLTRPSGERVDATFSVEGRLLTVTYHSRVKSSQLAALSDEAGTLWLAKGLLRSLIGEAA